jgi:hypothetical protein
MPRLDIQRHSTGGTSWLRPLKPGLKDIPGISVKPANLLCPDRLEVILRRQREQHRAVGTDAEMVYTKSNAADICTESNADDICTQLSNQELSEQWNNINCS